MLELKHAFIFPRPGCRLLLLGDDCWQLPHSKAQCIRWLWWPPCDERSSRLNAGVTAATPCATWCFDVPLCSRAGWQQAPLQAPPVENRAGAGLGSRRCGRGLRASLRCRARRCRCMPPTARRPAVCSSEPRRASPAACKPSACLVRRGQPGDPCEGL
ncbi:hypothetical protein BC831DRAFT_444572 [Entophlyctis helioformis]|nr:hypothetical protein BC831DRAFT_444572 [Entophlyctis helioformis]